MHAMVVDRDKTDLVDDQELGLAVKLQPLLDSIFGVGFRQRSDERRAWVKYVG